MGYDAKVEQEAASFVSQRRYSCLNHSVASVCYIATFTTQNGIHDEFSKHQSHYACSMSSYTDNLYM